MAFKGVQTGMNPTEVLRLALLIRSQNQKAQEDAERLRLDKMKTIAGLRKQGLEEQKTALELQKALRGEAPGVVEAQRSAESEFTPQDLSIPGAAPAESQAFGQIVAGADPQGVQRGIQAQQVLGDRVRTGTRARMEIDPSLTPEQARQSVLGGAQAARSQEGFERRQEIEKTIEKTIQKDIADARGSIQAGRVLINQERATKRAIDRAEAMGEDSSLLREELRFVQAIRRGKEQSGQIRVINPPSPELINKKQMELASDYSAISVIERIVEGLDEGRISAGVRGSVQSFTEGLRDWLSDLASTSEFAGPGSEEIRRAVQEAQTRSGSLSLPDSNGEQRSLSLDALTLAWQFVRANRGSGRITLMELNKTLDQLAPTGVFRSEKQYRSALRRVGEAILRSARTSEQFLEEFAPGVSFDPALSSEDQQFLDRISEIKGTRPEATPARQNRERPRFTVETLPENPTDKQRDEAMQAEIRRLLGEMEGGR